MVPLVLFSGFGVAAVVDASSSVLFVEVPKMDWRDDDDDDIINDGDRWLPGLDFCRC